MAMRGGSVSDNRVNHGGLLGHMSLRILFATSEMMIAKFGYDLCLLKRDETSEVKLILFPWLRRLIQLIFGSMCGVVDLRISLSFFRILLQLKVIKIPL